MSHQAVLSGSELPERQAETSTREIKQTIEISLNDLDMTPESLHNYHFANPDLKPIMDYLGILPQSQVKARSILFQQSDFLMVQGFLIHSRTPEAKRTKVLCKYQLVLPKALIQTILKLYHDSPLGAHSGI